MSTTIAPAPHASPSLAAPAPEVARGTARWPLWGAAAGVASLAAVIAGMPALDEEDYTAGPEVVEKLSAGGYRISFLLGLVAIGCLMVAGAGWRRWAEARAPRDLAARLIGHGLIGTATINTIFFGLAGAMGLYLEGGVEADTGVNDQGLYVYHAMLDFGSLLGWWTTAVSAIAVAVLAFRKARLLPRWMGITTVVLMLMPVGMAVGISLPGLVGFFLPLWLIIVSIGMVVSKVAHAEA